MDLYQSSPKRGGGGEADGGGQAPRNGEVAAKPAEGARLPETGKWRRSRRRGPGSPKRGGGGEAGGGGPAPRLHCPLPSLGPLRPAGTSPLPGRI